MDLTKNVYVKCDKVGTQFNDTKNSNIMAILPITVATRQLASYSKDNLTNLGTKMISSTYQPSLRAILRKTRPIRDQGILAANLVNTVE